MLNALAFFVCTHHHKSTIAKPEKKATGRRYSFGTGGKDREHGLNSKDLSGDGRFLSRAGGCAQRGENKIEKPLAPAGFIGDVPAY